MTKVRRVVDLKQVATPQREKILTFLLLITCLGILFSFLDRFPREAPSRPMEPIAIETYFNAGWENDSDGGFAWILNEKNKVIVANNEHVKKRGSLEIPLVGAPCGDSHEILVSSKSVSNQALTLDPYQKSEIKLQLTLEPFARVLVYLDVVGEGCSPSATDSRKIKLQVRQPVFNPFEPVTFETHFNAVWENDSDGGFAWILNEKNKIIVVNNENVTKSGNLEIPLLGAPCGDSHEVLVSSKSVSNQALTLDPYKNSEIKLQLTLEPFARVPVYLDVAGEGCSPSATDSRKIKVQVRQPVFVSS